MRIKHLEIVTLKQQPMPNHPDSVGEIYGVDLIEHSRFLRKRITLSIPTAKFLRDVLVKELPA